MPNRINITSSMAATPGWIKEHGPHRILETAPFDLNDQMASAAARGSAGAQVERPPKSIRQQRSHRVADLIGTWLADESGHDESFWPIFEKDLAEAE